MNKGSPPRKRLILVNRDLQLRYAWAAVAVGLGSTGLSTLLILYPLYKFQILRMVAFVPFPIMMVMIAAALINIFLVGFLGIYVTHRIAGPMYSLVRSFRQIEEGCFGGVLKTRDDDDLGYVVRNFNGMAESLRRMVGRDVGVLRGLRQQLDGDKIEVKGLKDELDGLIDQFEKRLSQTGERDHSDPEQVA